jgi:hypothetical protein
VLTRCPLGKIPGIKWQTSGIKRRITNRSSPISPSLQSGIFVPASSLIRLNHIRVTRAQPPAQACRRAALNNPTVQHFSKNLSKIFKTNLIKIFYTIQQATLDSVFGNFSEFLKIFFLNCQKDVPLRLVIQKYINFHHNERVRSNSVRTGATPRQSRISGI